MKRKPPKFKPGDLAMWMRSSPQRAHALAPESGTPCVILRELSDEEARSEGVVRWSTRNVRMVEVLMNGKILVVKEKFLVHINEMNDGEFKNGM